MKGGNAMIWELFKKPEPRPEGQVPEPSLSQQLRGCAQAVLEDWTGLSPEFLGLAGSRPSYDMVSLGATLNGPRQGLLCISASHKLGALLAVEATGDPGAGTFSGEALRELCQQLREALVTEALHLDSQDYLIHSPEPYSHERWPVDPPAIRLALRVKGLPLELRLWLFS